MFNKIYVFLKFSEKLAKTVAYHNLLEYRDCIPEGTHTDICVQVINCHLSFMHFLSVSDGNGESAAEAFRLEKGIRGSICLLWGRSDDVWYQLHIKLSLFLTVSVEHIFVFLRWIEMASEQVCDVCFNVEPLNGTQLLSISVENFILLKNVRLWKSPFLHT